VQENGKIAIVGGGVAGATTALILGKVGLDVTLFERESSLICGPPFCHLHAGGNLYRDISTTQCLNLLRQSIDFLRLYPFIVDYRPTVIATPIEDPIAPHTLLPRLTKLQQAYQKMIDNDPKNALLGESQEYFRTYSKEQMERLSALEIPQKPSNFDEWMISVAHHLDLEKIQFPLIMVQEYGLNLFQLASGVDLLLGEINTLTLKKSTSIEKIKRVDQHYHLSYHEKNKEITKRFDYLINATGFKIGKIDDMLGVSCRQMVEFKSAYISHAKRFEETLFPEIIFHGERGTVRGMGQFTPYPNGYFQLHGMTNDITLYQEGLVRNPTLKCQAKLGDPFIKKLEKGWSQKEIEERTLRAIAHISPFIPRFNDATVASKPLFGAQQIPGDDPSLRVAEVSFPLPNYARCEIVKVSSVIDMTRAILDDLMAKGFLDKEVITPSLFTYSNEALCLESITQKAIKIAQSRHYPADLASLNTPYPLK
jgi:hypothetical protein